MGSHCGLSLRGGFGCPAPLWNLELSYFKAKMYQIQFQSSSGPPGGAYSTLPDPLAGFQGPTSKGCRGREGRVGKGKEEGGEENSPLYISQSWRQINAYECIKHIIFFLHFMIICTENNSCFHTQKISASGPTGALPLDPTADPLTSPPNLKS